VDYAGKSPIITIEPIVLPLKPSTGGVLDIANSLGLAYVKVEEAAQQLLSTDGTL
jgi:hypothetical protein